MELKCWIRTIWLAYHHVFYLYRVGYIKWKDKILNSCNYQTNYQRFSSWRRNPFHGNLRKFNRKNLSHWSNRRNILIARWVYRGNEGNAVMRNVGVIAYLQNYRVRASSGIISDNVVCADAPDSFRFRANGAMQSAAVRTRYSRSAAKRAIKRFMSTVARNAERSTTISLRSRGYLEAGTRSCRDELFAITALYKAVSATRHAWSRNLMSVLEFWLKITADMLPTFASGNMRRHSRRDSYVVCLRRAHERALGSQSSMLQLRGKYDLQGEGERGGSRPGGNVTAWSDANIAARYTSGFP